MKKRAVFLAMLLCTCDGRGVGLAPCKEDPSLPGSCSLAEECSGECSAIPPLGWSPPALLWTGPLLMAPECPADWTATIGYEGYANLLSPECASCACEPPTGQCGLPTTMTVSTEPCDYDGITFSVAGLDPNPNVCSTENGLDLLCELSSLTIGPLSMVETGCTPVELPPAPMDGSLAWATFARACERSASPPCLDGSSSCALAADPPPEFSQCIYRRGDRDCPPAYSKRLVFYDDASDTRACAACSCGPPIKSLCSAFVSTYRDAMCSHGLIGSLMNSWGTGLCNDISPACSLLGKRAEDLTYEPGSCEPLGGDLVGTAELLGPTTFCCQEDGEAPPP